MSTSQHLQIPSTIWRGWTLLRWTVHPLRSEGSSPFRRGAIFPSLCTLITRLRSNIPAHECHNALLEVVRNRASVGNAIQRLRVIVPSEEHVVLYSDNFYLFVEQFETQVSTRGESDPPRWLVWKD